MADKRYALLLAAFTELQAAAQKVVDDVAPASAIAELRALLARYYGLSR